MVSYINVQHTPAVYKGSVTDHSLLPVIAGHPNKAPQLKASPNNYIIYIICKLMFEILYNFGCLIPRYNCGQNVTRFINGYIVTILREVAPNKILQTIT